MARFFTRIPPQIINAVAIWLVFFAAYTWVARPSFDGGDDQFYLALADGWRQFGSPRMPDGNVTKWSFGHAIVCLPVGGTFRDYKTAESADDEAAMWRALFRINLWSALVAAAFPALLFLLARVAGFDPRVALASAICVGAGSMFVSYTQRLWADNTLLVGLSLVLIGLVAYLRTPHWRGLLLSALAAGFLVVVKPYAVILSGPLMCAALLLWWRRRDPVPWLVALVPSIIGVLAALLYNYWRYQGWFSFGYEETSHSRGAFSTPVITGMLGLLLSAGKGFFWYNPVMILALPGMWLLYKRERVACLVTGLMCGILVVFFACWEQWHGDWAWGPRYMLALLPFLLLPLACSLAAMFAKRSLYLRLVLGGLLGASLYVQALGVLMSPDEFLRIAHTHSPQPLPPPDTELQDSLAMSHFIPELSPLAGHAWMIRAKRDSSQLTQPPWYRYTIWMGPGMEAVKLRWNIWWLERQSPVVGIGLGLLLLVGLGGLLLRCAPPEPN